MAARPAHTGYASPPLPTVASIPLSSSQAVRIHGWFAPSRRLSWQEVRQRPDLTFCTLYATLSGRLAHEAGRGGAQRHSCPESSRALDSLYLMQPSILQWIAARKVALVDYEVMHRRWAVNPITDFGSRVRIGELLQAKLSHEAMLGCGLSVDALCAVGMTPEVMRLFRFSLEEWMRLGLQSGHVNAMTAAQVEGVFGLTKNVLEASLRGQR